MATIRDKNVAWLRKRVLLPFQTHNGYLLTAGAPPTVTSLGAGGRAWTQRTGLNMTGLIFTAAGDAVEFDTMIPYDWDLQFEIGVRVVWTSNAAAIGARTITWAVTYGVVGIPGVAVVSAATALDAAIAAQAPSGVNNALERGVRGVIAQSSVRTNFINTSYWMSWKVSMAAFNAAFVENKYYLGLEVDYMPRRTYGPGSLQNRNVLANPFDRGQAPSS
jgi:hypothetical protein